MNYPARVLAGMCGLPGAAARDFVESAGPVDLYNVERAEVASGPNSILFGLGSAGGLVALTGKQARLGRNSTTLKTQIGSWDFHRLEGDYNRVLIPKKLSLRLLGVYQNAHGWRVWDFSDQKRGTAAATVQPFRDTTINASVEKGKTANSIAIDWNAGDGITLWNANGRPRGDAAAVPETERLNTANNRFTFIENDGRVLNLRGELLSSGQSAPTLLTRDLSPYDYNLTGPGGIRRQDIDTHQVQLTQRLGKDLTFVLAWHHNKTDVRADGMEIYGMGLPLRGDPNITSPAADGSTGTFVNPRAGQLFSSRACRIRTTRGSSRARSCSTNGS